MKMARVSFYHEADLLAFEFDPNIPKFEYYLDFESESLDIVCDV